MPELNLALSGALSVAGLGVRTFPVWAPVNGQCACPLGASCESPGKHPIEAGWQESATTNAVRIRRWAKTYHGCNYGLTTADIRIVDVDPRNGGSDEGLPPTGWVVNTGGGGWHLGYTPNGVLANAKLGPGLDLKADGGFVVAPGSMHVSGRRYTWETQPRSPAAVAPWPGREALGAPAAPASPAARAVTGAQEGWFLTMWAGVAEGGRNDACARMAGYLIGNGLSTQIVEGVLQDWATRCDPPMSPDEVHRTVVSIDRKERVAKTKPADQPTTDKPTTLSEHDKKVSGRIESLKVDQEARRLLAAELFERPDDDLPVDEDLQLDDEELEWAVKGLLPVGGNALLAAKFKAGKTTMLLNLMRSFVDGTPFLGQIPAVLESGRRVAYFNYEMGRGHFRAWLRRLHMVHPERAVRVNLRGKHLQLDNPEAQAWAVEWLKQREVDVWLVDPFARAYAGEENSNTEVSHFTSVLDDIKDRAGVSTLVVAAHFGRKEFEEGEEHVRGATRLDDWADARWMLTRKDDERFLSAEGRDISFDESRLSYHHDTGDMTLIGGSRSQRQSSKAEDAVMGYIGEQVKRHKGEMLRVAVTSRAIRAGVDARSQAVDKALKDLVSRRVLVVVEGPRGQRFHYPDGHPEIDRML